MRNCFGTHNSTPDGREFLGGISNAKQIDNGVAPEVIGIYPCVAGYARILLGEIAQLMNRDVT